MPHRPHPNLDGAIGALAGITAGVAVVGGIVILLSGPADAQQARREAQSTNEFERPIGFGYGQESQPYDAATRVNGNRVVVNGLIEGGTGVAFYGQASATASASASATASASAGAFAGASASSMAVGNQINVVTNGSNNTVVVNATQTNSGNQTVVLNGKVNLDD